MDQVTHLVLGAALAQIPTSLSKPSQPLDWKKRATIGASAALFPDIDYLLFFYQPLNFIAYWHRAETHSLLLAPVFALVLTLLWKFIFRQWPTKLVFYISLVGICSHSLLDSFTPFGIQLFAPITRDTFSWNLLYVVDVYFTLAVILMFFLLVTKRTAVKQVLAFVVPISYLLFVLWNKSIVTATIRENLAYSNSVILPQPFSPMHWKAVSALDNGYALSFVKILNDPVASFVANIADYSNLQDKYTRLDQLKWYPYPLRPQLPDGDMVVTAWQHPKFQAFRDFSHFPAFLYVKNSDDGHCIWFTDLRYFEANTKAYFRYAMCLKKGDWHVVRGEYF